MRIAGLTRGQIDDENARIGATVQIAFVQTIADMLWTRGFELAQDFDLGRIGLLYYVAASSETLVEALRRIERFSGVGNEAVQFSCVSGRALEIGSVIEAWPATLTDIKASSFWRRCCACAGNSLDRTSRPFVPS